MRKLAILLSMAASASCAEATTAPQDDAGVNEGTVEFTLTRSSASGAPVDGATHAIVRVWNPSSGFNFAQSVAIPDASQSTMVTMQAPARDGYSAGVLAVDGPVGPSIPNVLAAGITAGITVVKDQQTEAVVSVESLSVELTEVPALLTPGEEATIRGRVMGAPIAAEGQVPICV